jgi:hypothetical protein
VCGLSFAVRGEKFGSFIWNHLWELENRYPNIFAAMNPGLSAVSYHTPKTTKSEPQLIQCEPATGDPIIEQNAI